MIEHGKKEFSNVCFICIQSVAKKVILIIADIRSLAAGTLDGCVINPMEERNGIDGNSSRKKLHCSH